MATTKTTKIANAISLLSDVRSDEVADGKDFLEAEDDTVSSDDFDEVKDSAANFVTDQVNGLESIKQEIEDEIGTGGFAAWDVEDDEEDEYEDEVEDDVGNGNVVIEQNDEDGAGVVEQYVEPTDAEKIEILMAAGEELDDKIEELVADKDALTEALTAALDAIDSLVEDVESHQSELEVY